MKAKYSYRSGHVLLLPKEPQSSMLFLEYIRDQQQLLKKQGIKTPINIEIKDAGETRTDEDDYFKIRINVHHKDFFTDAVEYINNNLPIVVLLL